MEATNLLVKGDAVFNGKVYGLRFTDTNWSSNVKTSTSNNYYKIGSVDLSNAKEYATCILIDITNIGSTADQSLYGDAFVRFAINKDVGVSSSVIVKSRTLSKDNFKIHILNSGSIYDFYLFLSTSNISASFSSIAESSINSLGVIDNAVMLNANAENNWVGTPSGTLSETIYEGISEFAARLETARKITLTGAVTGNVNFDGSQNVEINTTVNHTHDYLPSNGNAVSASKLSTARQIALTGAITGTANFDGSKNIEITTSVNHTHTAAEVGAAAASHSHSDYLAKSGGTMTGDIIVKKGTTSAIPIRTYEGDASGGALVVEYGGATYIGSGEAGSSLKTALGYSNGNEILIFGSDTSIEIYTNCQTIGNRKKVSIDTAGKITAEGGFSGALTGNASTATKLQTARTVRTNLGSESAPSFDGSANLTPGVSGTLPVAHGGTGNTTGTATYLNANAMPANADFNSYTTPGFYYCNANATVGTMSNRPTGNAFFMIVGKHAGVSQTVFEYMTTGFKIYHRNCYIGSWGAWVRVYTTIDKPSASDVGAAAASHTHNYAAASHTHTAADVGAAAASHSHSDYLAKSGGTMTGALIAQANTAYTTAQVRNITMSTAEPSGGTNGQIHFKYT